MSLLARWSSRILPPGLLISSRTKVLPESVFRRGAGAACVRGASFMGFTRMVGICISLDWIGYHLAAARSGGPAPKDRGKLAGRATRHDDLDLLRLPELAIA